MAPPLGPRRWLAACRAKLPSASPGWRLRKIGGRLIFMRKAEVAFAVAQVLRYAAVKQLHYDTFVWLAYACVAVASLLLLRRSLRRPMLFELVEFLHSFVGPFLAVTTAPNALNLFARYRLEVFLFFWSLVPALASGMRSVLYMPLLAASVVAHSATMFAMDSDVETATKLLGALTYLVVGLFFALMAMAQSRLLLDLQLAEQSALQEKEASAAVLSMFCDAQIMLAGDADTIDECDSRFAHIMGRAMQGQRISEHVEPSEYAQKQFHELRRTLTGADVSSTPTPVTAHPISLISTSGSHVKVTLYAVGHRRRADAAARFAVGVVMNESEVQPPVELRDTFKVKKHGSEAIMEDSISMIGDLQLQRPVSEAPTTRTGVLFRPFVVGDPKDVDVVSALGQLAELGRKEHWLVEPEELQLRPEALGAGGFGSVHSAKFCGAPVVVKLVKESVRCSNIQSVASLVNELRVLRHCRHPNLVHLQGAVIDTKLCRVGLILEMLPRGNLELWVNTRGATDPSRFRVMVGVCRGLWFLHTRVPTITHGDLKAQNVLIVSAGRDETAKVLDFGLSRLQAPDGSGLSGGSLRWMAPEQAQGGRGQSSPAIDVFAFGRLLEFLITGRQHYEGVPGSVIRQELSSGRLSPPAWSAEPRPLEQCCRPVAEACLALNPDARPSMGKLHECLLAVPTKDFDDQHRSAGRIRMDSENHVPWHEAVKPAALEPAAAPAAPPERGAGEDQSPSFSCRYSRMSSLMASISQWHMEVGSASCCELHTALWQACRDLHDLHLAPCDTTTAWRVPWPSSCSGKPSPGAKPWGCGRCSGCLSGKVSL